MRVLVVHHQFSYYGGAELAIAKLVHYLVSKHVEAKVLTLETSEEANKEMKGADIELLYNGQFMQRRDGIFSSPSELFKALNIMRAAVSRHINEYDIVFVHGFPETWCVFPKRKPTFWMCGEPPNLWSVKNPSFRLRLLKSFRDAMDRFIVKNYIDVIGVADSYGAERVRQIYSKEPRIIPYGVDYSFFSKGDAKKADNKFKLKGSFVIVQSGMIIEQKNQLASIKAIEGLKGKIKKVKLVLAGKGGSTYENMLRRYVDEHSLNNNVIFAGNLPRGEVRDLYKAADVGIFPIHPQGGWLAPIEMLSASKPIIVSKEMTASKMLYDNNSCIVTDNFGEALLDVYKHKSKYKKMGKHGSDFVKTNLSWEKFGERIYNVFREMTSD